MRPNHDRPAAGRDGSGDEAVIRILCGEEIMAHFPSGQVRFLTFWGCIRLLWWAIRTNTPIEIVEDKPT